MEEERILERLEIFCEIQYKFACLECTQSDQKIVTPNDIIASSISEAVSILNTGMSLNCDVCQASSLKYTYAWVNGLSPPFFYIILGDKKEKETNVPQNILLIGQNYNLFAYTVKCIKADHFVVVFIGSEKKLLYDGKNRRTRKYKPFPKNDHCVSTVWFLKA